MSKFERVLSDGFFTDLGARTAHTNWVGFGRQVEQAVLAKLAGQKHIAEVGSDFQLVYAGSKPICEIEGLRDGMKLYAHPAPHLKQAPTAWEVKNKNTGRGHITETKNIAEGASSCEFMSVRPLYTRPIPNNQGLLDSSSHIVDSDKMVADMYWINPDYPSYTSILDAFEPITLSVEVEIGDQFEVSRAKTLPALTIEVTELEKNGDVKDYKVLGGDHIADVSKMVPEGWQLVPVEPIEEMLKRAFPEIFDIDGISKNDLIERYQAMLAAAPRCL